MSRGSKRHVRTLRIIILGEDDKTVKELCNNYERFLSRGLSKRPWRHIVLAFTAAAQAWEKIDAGFSPHVVVFSRGFPALVKGSFILELNGSNVEFVDA